MSSAKFAVFDTETTGVDTGYDRIVQFFGALADENGNLIETREWFINPGVPIPEEAAGVHGFTEEFLAENGGDPKEVLLEIKEWLSSNRHLISVAFNMNFDLSVLDAEFKRHGISETFGTWMRDEAKLVDGIVIDRHKDKYRKGKRTLEATAAHYGVPFDPELAHDAGYDVEVTAKVTKKILDKFGTPTTQEQSSWYASWAEGLEKYLRRTDPSAKVNRGWPLRHPEGD